MFSLVVAVSDAAVLCAEVPSAEATTPLPSGMMLVPRSSEKNSSRTANPRMINITYNNTKMTPILENLSQTLSLVRLAITTSLSLSHFFSPVFLLFLQIVIIATKAGSNLTKWLHLLYYTTLSRSCHLTNSTNIASLNCVFSAICAFCQKIALVNCQSAQILRHM